MVDDQQDLRDAVAEYLEAHDIRVTRCPDGAALRDLMRSTVPDAVLLDLSMPGEDGLTVLRTLKRDSSVPVILLTANSGPIDRVVGLELGADDFLAKPCDFRELLARLRSVMRRHASPVMASSRRQLASIVSFDLVGFGRMLQENEAATLAGIDRVFSEILVPSLPRHHGTVFKTTGDGALIEFLSAVESVEWAMEFQRTVPALTAEERGPSKMQFRLGVAIGDIVFSGADRLGEGVALAVRVQEVGRPGAVTLSDFTHKLVRGRVRSSYADRGVHLLKNIPEPMQVWDWKPDPAA